MPIDFSPERWENIRTVYAKWWAGELERPIIPVWLRGKDPGREMPATPLLSQQTCTDLSLSPEDIIDRIDYELSTLKYLGDAYPIFNMDCFGPGVLAAMMGARLDNSSGRVWFFGPKDVPITDIHFEFDSENQWFKRISDIYAAAMERWQGLVLMGMTDLGGNLDVLSTFRPSEKLLMDLYDHPEEVKCLTWEAHEAWHQAYSALNAILQPVNPGYSDWSLIYSDRPCYIQQCDFSYMISPKMFEEFIKPELAATSGKLERSFYHLDGIGQIAHLDSLLEIETLNGVQWIPGDGKPDCANWPELYQKINAAGKRIQIINGGFAAIDAVIEQVGTSNGIQYQAMLSTIDQEQEIRVKLGKYGIEN
ncbi:MAG: hypothetical protein JXB38_11345 [Anaerolineales bacterium]|nr:hypothetical protein [Anaerolineales bacterium]